VAQNRIRLAQARQFTTLPSRTGPETFALPPASGGGPWKPINADGTGDQAEKIYAFLKALFANDLAGVTPTYRDKVWSMSDDQVRNEIYNKLGYDMRGYSNVLIIIVDIQNGRIRFSDNQGCSSVGGCSIVNHGGDPSQTFWYTFVLPPIPLEFQKASNVPEDGYLNEMSWEAAWHHAVVYGYGM
jgi:hypothetical protein